MWGLVMWANKKGVDQTVESLECQAWDVHFVLSMIESHWKVWGKAWHDQSSALGESVQQVCGW